jgi:N-methylhydantoinase B
MRDVDVRDGLEAGRIVMRESDVGYQEREVLEAKARTVLSSSDMLLTRNEGGPGFGDPLRRSAELVARDVHTGLCRPGDAEQIYGVVLGEEGVDNDATDRRRAEMRRERLRESAPVTELVGTRAVALAR